MDAPFGQLPINCEWFMAKYSRPSFSMAALNVLESAKFHIDLHGSMDLWMVLYLATEVHIFYYTTKTFYIYWFTGLQVHASSAVITNILTLLVCNVHD